MLQNHPADSASKEAPSASSSDDGSVTKPKRKLRKMDARRRMASAVTTGRRLFVLGDGNSPWSRRYSDLVRLHAQDLSGGVDLSQAQQSLIRRAAAIECELESMEGKLSLGQEVDLDLFTRSTSHLRRILETLGVRRVPHEINPHLDTYLATPKNPDVVNGDATSKQPHAGREVVTQPETAPAEGEPEGAS